MNRPQQEGCTPDPIGQRRAIEHNALPSVDLGLPIKRKVIGIFGETACLSEANSVPALVGSGWAVRLPPSLFSRRSLGAFSIHARARRHSPWAFTSVEGAIEPLCLDGLGKQFGKPEGYATRSIYIRKHRPVDPEICLS